MRKKVVFLPYDFDTAIGTNNEGALVFDYGLEDTDTLSGGANVFNGQNSVLWNNVRKAFPDELAAMYQTLRSTGALSYDKVEQMFEEHQGKWPEAIFNEDAYYKYLEPLLVDGTGAYLSMLQGSKAEQRKWWLYNRFRYIDSKYNAGDALTDYIQLRGYAKADITVTPYADIYPTIKYGSYVVSKRGRRGVETLLECPLDDLNDTEIYVYSASQLASVGDLSGLKVGFADFSMATKLQDLKIGDGSEGYANENLTELTLGNNTLLKTIDVRNCPNLADTVDASGCTNIEQVYFDGTSVPSVTLPNGGVVKVLHLPGTITNLTLRNQPQLTEFECPDYSNISTFRLENSSGIDPLEVLNGIQAGSRVRIIGLNMEVTSTDEIDELYDLLDTMRGLDENGNNVDKAQVQGTITGLDNVTGAWLGDKLERYPNIDITYNHVTAYLYYYNYDGSSLIYTETINDGGNGSYSGTPSRTSTAQYTFSFVGWNKKPDQTVADAKALLNVVGDRKVYAAYTPTLRYYTVTFKNNDGTTLQTYTNSPYGGSVTYTGTDPVYVGDGAEDYTWTGEWSPSPENIQGDTTCYPVYKYNGYYFRKIIDRSISGAYENDAATSIGDYAFYYCTKLTSVDFPTVTSIGDSAFFCCTKLTSVDFPAVTSIASYAFYYCTKLTSVDFPAVTSIASSAFRSCTSLTSVDFPAVTSIGDSAFRSCTSLTSVILRGTEKVCGLSATSAFTNTPIASGTGYVYVPDELVDDYKAATNWSFYADQIKPLSELEVNE